MEMAAEHRPCDFISYFGQSYERVDTSATSESILRTYGARPFRLAH